MTDSVTDAHADMRRVSALSEHPQHVPGRDARWLAALPPEAPLDMPTQSLRSWNTSDGRPPINPGKWRTPWLSRLFVFGSALLLTGYGVREMYEVVSVSRTTALQYVLLMLFTVNFSWIALAFTSAVLGFLVLLFQRPQAPHATALAKRTVIVMPVYNEQTARTFAAVAAIRESVDATGLGAHFDYFILSDTTNPDVWVAEERAFLALRERLGPDARLYYRHRPKTILARPATSLTLSRAGAAIMNTWSFSTPTA